MTGWMGRHDIIPLFTEGVHFEDFPDLDNPVTFNYNSELHFIIDSVF